MNWSKRNEEEKKLTERQERLGNRLIEVLNLKVAKNGRVDTALGEKVPVGLGRLVVDLVEEIVYENKK